MSEEFDALKRSRARAYLESVRDLRYTLDALQDEIEMERKVMQPKGMRFDRIGGCSSAYADAIPDGVARLEAMAARYVDAERAYIEAADGAHAAIAAAQPMDVSGERRRFIGFTSLARPSGLISILSTCRPAARRASDAAAWESASCA